MSRLKFNVIMISKWNTVEQILIGRLYSLVQCQIALGFPSADNPMPDGWTELIADDLPPPNQQLANLSKVRVQLFSYEIEHRAARAIRCSSHVTHFPNMTHLDPFWWPASSSLHWWWADTLDPSRRCSGDRSWSWSISWAAWTDTRPGNWFLSWRHPYCTADSPGSRMRRRRPVH